ncbi:OmpA family protein [Pararhodobacter sp. CCB-MM2]|uniref:OmpA family protein n=1 Tax=Pararhodobacter sp. CCB-MM2 TaxID=1786003 RepID=UPI0009F65474|nr:OmpA family protein [Pararhodobacter sp. CCB-MM2]MCA2013073.1 OmpA family protein [Cereibacter sphaeroides]
MRDLSKSSLSLTRRTLMMGAAGGALSACTGGYGPELGSHLDEGGFGTATAHNILIQTGQLDYAVILGERFAREVPNTITFAFDSAELDAGAQQVLMAQAAWMRRFPELAFRVFGHTDLVGSERYNRGLGLRRARAAAAFIVRQGISRSRVQGVITNGETQPLIPTPDRERQNRRAVTEVSGFVQNHPRVLNGEYALIVHRQYVESADRNTNVPAGSF